MKRTISTFSILVTTAVLSLSAQAKIAREVESTDDLQTEIPDEDSTLESGTGVNNGMGPLGKIVDCESDNGNYSFTMNHTALLTYKQATLHIGDRYVSMLCKNTDENNPSWTGAAYPWSCTEMRAGEGLYSVEVFAPVDGSDEFTGTVSMAQMFPLKPHQISTMTCRDPSAK